MNASQFADAVRDLAKTVIADRSAALRAARLRTTVELEPWEEDTAEGLELRIAFLRENAFIDVVEDFVIQGGKPVASIEDLKQWLEGRVDEILTENS